jgi:hypothetical protein
MRSCIAIVSLSFELLIPKAWRVGMLAVALSAVLVGSVHADEPLYFDGAAAVLVPQAPIPGKTNVLTSDPDHPIGTQLGFYRLVDDPEDGLIPEWVVFDADTAIECRITDLQHAESYPLPNTRWLLGSLDGAAYFFTKEGDYLLIEFHGRALYFPGTMAGTAYRGNLAECKGDGVFYVTGAAGRFASAKGQGGYFNCWLGFGGSENHFHFHYSHLVE